MTVIVLDNGGGQIKAGLAGDRDPLTIFPNCQARPISSKKFLTGPSLLSPHQDLTSATLRRPIDRGYLINSDLQSTIWAHLFSSLNLTPSLSSLLLTEPLFNLPSCQRAFDEMVFEEFGFRSLYVANAPELVHLYEASRRPYGVVSKRECSLVVDCGFSFVYCAPVFQNFCVNYGVKRMDLGGKALSNYLKELISYRSVNVMDESFLMDHVKEKLCFVSLDVERDLVIARKRGYDNIFKCTYVLPDGVTYTKGFVKDPAEADRYLTLYDGATGQHTEKMETDQQDHEEKLENKNKIDLTKNVKSHIFKKLIYLQYAVSNALPSEQEFSLTNERFLVPEMIFRPADLGMNQAGLAECIVRAVNSCHPYLQPVLYESIILTGGSTLFPRFAERLERELRPLVPDNYQVKISTQEDPILGVWRGGSLLASSPDFESMCVTKAEYEELGSFRCRRRFFH